MRKLYSLVLLGLLASTNPIFAMDEITDGTDIGAQSDKFSAASPTNMMEVSSREVPEGNDVPWYDDEVASGSPDARGRAKSIEQSGDGWGDGEGLLEELAARSSEGTGDPLAASVMMSAATDRAKLSLEEMAAEDDEDSLPTAATLGRQQSVVGDEAVEGKTSTAVAAPVTVYFGSTPERDQAKAILSVLIKDEDTFATNQLDLVLNYLFDPDQDEMPKEGFDFNDFARQLEACENTEAQIAFLTEMEHEHGAAWQSDEEDAEGELDD